LQLFLIELAERALETPGDVFTRFVGLAAGMRDRAAGKGQSRCD